MVEDEREEHDERPGIFWDGARPGRVFPNSHDVNFTSRDLLRVFSVQSANYHRGGGRGVLSRFRATHYFLSFSSMATLARLSLFVCLLLGIVSASRFETVRSSEPHRPSRSKRVSRRSCQAPPNTDISACFPALGFTTPSSVPASTNGWWCDPVNEYAFLGFSYEVTACEHPNGFFLSSINSLLFYF
jgi:hypothetical protein